MLLKWRHPDERVITSGIILHTTLRYTRNIAVKGLIKALFIVKQHNILYYLHFSVMYYDVVHNNTWYVNEVSINENHTYRRCVYMKTNVIYRRNRYFYVLIWNIAGFSTRDRIFLCLSTHSTALHSWKDIKFLSLVEDPPFFHINVWKNLNVLVCFVTILIYYCRLQKMAWKFAGARE